VRGVRDWRLPVFVILCEIGAASAVLAQTVLPDVVVSAPAPEPAAPAAPAPAASPASAYQTKIDALETSRDSFLLPKLGASSFTLDRAAIDSLPRGDNTPIDKVMLQAPGVAQDSALNNPDFHIRNEYSNVQYRIDGIPLPLGINGLGTVLDTGFVGGLRLLDGVLPAQYGLRTAGVIDIASRKIFEPGGSFSLYGGSFGTFSPRIEYGGVIDDTQYFFTGRYFRSNEGLENAMPTVNPLHDRTEQGKFFGYVSKLLSDSSRLVFMTGASSSQFQIPNVAGETPLGDWGGLNWSSALLNERERDNFLFNVAALQTKGADFETQLSLYSGYATAHFMPDIPGDLAFDNAASEVRRRSFSNGVNFDGAYKLNDQHVLRGGLLVNAEATKVSNAATVLPLDDAGAPLPTPETLTQTHSKVGWTLGAYVQDEWKLTDRLTLNSGLRFDQLYQFVNANQFSPRISLTWKPREETTVHLGYARYFTPPSQAQATPVDAALYANTTLQPAIEGDSPVRPERSHYFDLGAEQKLFGGLAVGGDLYYKVGTDILDDGQFGLAQFRLQARGAVALGRQRVRIWRQTEFLAKQREDREVAAAQQHKSGQEEQCGGERPEQTSGGCGWHVLSLLSRRRRPGRRPS
jgi:hypothetical protein